MSFDSALSDALQTTQRDPILGREADMVKNAAGGYAFKIDDLAVLNRFLITGTEGGTFYTGQKTLTLGHIKNMRQLIDADGVAVVERTATISHEGRAPKNDQAIFVLALCVKFGNAETRKAAASKLHVICRTGTHLFQFMEFLQLLKCGLGRGVKRAIANWYVKKPIARMLLQVMKYEQRGGWNHRDILRLVRPKVDDPIQNAIFRYVTHPHGLQRVKDDDGNMVSKRIDMLEQDRPAALKRFIELKKAYEPDAAAKVLASDHVLTFEMCQKEALAGKDVYEELLPRLQMTALIRNLPTMTRLGVLKDLSDQTYDAAARLTDSSALQAERVHPVTMLIAAMTYQMGRSLRGDETWTPVEAISDALNEGYIAAFHGLEPIDKNVYIGVDVSGSMTWESNALMGIPHFYPATAAGALSIALKKQCKRSVIRGFSDGMVDLPFTVGMSLSAMQDVMNNVRMGRTDCALPMLDAMREGLHVDTFIILTDDESWYGEVHPVEALAEYRKRYNPNAKLIAVAMSATDYSIADPNDPGMMDVVGFDAAIPQLVRGFIG